MRTTRSPRRCSTKVGAEIRLRRCRTSVSRNASITPLRAPGLDAARSKPAHQALAWASPERLGANVSMPAGPPHAATIEQNETAHPGEGGQECPAPGLLPGPFDVGHEAGQHQNIDAPGAVGLER